MRRNLVPLLLLSGLIATLIVVTLGRGMIVESVWTSTFARLQTAATFFVASITPEEIRERYSQAGESRRGKAKRDVVRVLIVPGHQPKSGGTAFNNIYERDLVLSVATALAELLKANSRYEVMVSRDGQKWHATLDRYFKKNADEIAEFQQDQAAIMARHVRRGNVLLSTEQVHHNAATTSAALQLYGINKWANEHNTDIVLHLHINDYAGRRAGEMGRHDGFAVYVPEQQYSNAVASKEIGQAIARRLNAYHATSTLPGENVGVVEDQELIAIGSNNTADSAALLIEYAYIYEPQFHNSAIRELAVADYAYQTYLGLQDFFEDPISSSYGSLSFPYDWQTLTDHSVTRGPGIYALQAALRHLGFYPPQGESFNACPISGVFLDCTQRALRSYQQAQGLAITGVLDSQTTARLDYDLQTP